MQEQQEDWFCEATSMAWVARVEALVCILDVAECILIPKRIVTVACLVLRESILQGAHQGTSFFNRALFTFSFRHRARRWIWPSEDPLDIGISWYFVESERSERLDRGSSNDSRFQAGFRMREVWFWRFFDRWQEEGVSACQDKGHEGEEGQDRETPPQKAEARWQDQVEEEGGRQGILWGDHSTHQGWASLHLGLDGCITQLGWEGVPSSPSLHTRRFVPNEVRRCVRHLMEAAAWERPICFGNSEACHAMKPHMLMYVSSNAKGLWSITFFNSQSLLAAIPFIHVYMDSSTVSLVSFILQSW